MIKRFKPAQPDGTKVTFSLPSTYIGGIITIFVNGQMLYSQDNTSDTFGYTLDEVAKTFTFYTPLESDDFLYVMYDSEGGSDVASDFSGSGLMRLSKGFNVVSFMGKSLSTWNSDTKEVNYTTDVLANVENMIIKQVISTYPNAGDNAENIIREIQTYDDDSGKYRTYKPSATDTFWSGDGEHTINADLAKTPESSDSQGSTIYYNPNNFILSKCLLDNDGKIISGDADNNIVDLPSGLRQGIWIYVKENADLSSTDGKLELWY